GRHHAHAEGERQHDAQRQQALSDQASEQESEHRHPWPSPDYTEVVRRTVAGWPARNRLLGWASRAARPDRGVIPVDRPEIILAPGPTPIPPEVLLAQGGPLVYHRGPGFGGLMRDVTARLRTLYRAERARILLLTASGTGGLESAIQNCFSPGDEVFVPLAGFFAERWARLADAFRLTVHPQEALSASPGISFVAISDRAWGAAQGAENPRFYFDWREYQRFAELPDPENPWTPAISVMQGLHAALELYFQDGVDAALLRHQRLSRAVKDGVRALGLDLFGQGLDHNWTVTAIRAPEGISADTICDRIRSDLGVVL